MADHEIKTCNCGGNSSAQKTVPASITKKTVRSFGSVFLGVLIAFFPKCPVCMAAYLSMFGSFGMAQAKYMTWLFPVLILFLGLHLFLLFKKIPKKGYGPFLLSLAGALIILAGRKFFQFDNYVLYTGMACILAGSLWNSFSLKHVQPTFSNQ
jgi:mercuric ion transport protein